MASTARSQPPVPASRSTRTISAKPRGRPAGGRDDVGREALLAIAGELLRTTPPETVTRLMIAERANVDPGLIRYYFGTVDHLIAEIVMASHLRIRQSVLDLVEMREPTEALRTRLEMLVDLHIENPFHHRLIRRVMYGDGKTEEHREWIASLRTSLKQTEELIAQAVGRGIFRSVDPRLLQLTLIGVAEFFGSNPEIVHDLYEKRETIRTLRDSYVEFLLQLFLHGLCERG